MSELPEKLENCPTCNGLCRRRLAICGSPMFQKGYEDTFESITDELQSKIADQQAEIEQLVDALKNTMPIVDNINEDPNEWTEQERRLADIFHKSVVTLAATAKIRRKDFLAATEKTEGE